MKKQYIRYKNKTDIYNQYSLLLASIMVNAYKWENTPIEENQVWLIENNLFFRGSCLIIKEGGYFVLPLSDMGKQDTNGLLMKAQPIAYNGVSFPTYWVRGPKQNAVLVYNNLFRFPTYSFIRPILERLNYAWGSIGIAEANSRVKNIINVNDPNQKDVMNNLINYLTDNNNPAIITYNDNLSSVGSQSKTGGLVDTNDLINIWKDFNMAKSLLLEWLGITNNPEVDKKERMITGEIDSNNQLTLLVRNSMLNFRKQAIKECQKVFGAEWSKADVNFQIDKEADDKAKEMAKTMFSGISNNPINERNENKQD